MTRSHDAVALGDRLRDATSYPFACPSMATVSPTLMAATGPVRRPSQHRQPLRRFPSRSVLAQSESQLVATTAPAQPQQQHESQPRHHARRHLQRPPQYRDDSSEDEIPVPMKLSALTKAILNDGASEAVDGPPSPPRTRRRVRISNTSATAQDPRSSRAVSEQAFTAGDGASSKPTSRDASPVRRRVVRLSNTPQNLGQVGLPSKRRLASTSRSSGSQRAARPLNRVGTHDSSAEARPNESLREHQRPDINTPLRGLRVVRLTTGSSSSASGKRGRMGSLVLSSGSNLDHSGLETDLGPLEVPETAARISANIGSHGSVFRHTFTRPRAEDNANQQSSMRIKRVGKIPGSFLSGPARRGRRRQSEEDAEDNGEGEHMQTHEPEPEPEPESKPVPPPIGLDAEHSYYANGIRSFNCGSPISVKRRHASNPHLQESPQAASRLSTREARVESAPSLDEAAERIELPASLDHENEIPAGHRQSKVADELQVPEKRPPRRPVSVSITSVSPERKPLTVLADNTPRRPAPPPPPAPPPKMSVLEAATSTAGAAAMTTQAKQRRNVLRVNGKCYTRLDCLGRGGSAKVYRVSAENGHMFALKRVALDNADEATMRGYKGEIDLLARLSDVDRVIKLFDHELNMEKQVLTLLMEMGELDLNKLLSSRMTPEHARFDPVFVRFYWKEMLECLQAVHQHDIVHSDLKPANFVLVRGRLKLIDFGIANAIRIDETVNVHRETQIGTPNYMSPESLLDANSPRGGSDGLAGWRPKLMKLGKPSDVWSLGCILYQMVFGLPPFGHMANQMARCQAIIDWNHNIEFPSRGVGSVTVPPSLLRTMRRCLQRDQQLRPSCDELLRESDPFLYPSELGDRALAIDEELLGRIVQSVVARCRECMPTEAETQTVWPQAYWANIRKAMAGKV